MCVRGHAGLSQLVVHGTTERLPGAREAGHDGAHGNAHHASYLSVRQPLQFAEHEHFAKTIRQVAHRSLDQRDVVGVKQRGFRIETRTNRAVVRFVEEVGWCVKAPVAPAAGRVANNPEEPGAPITTSECAEVSKGPQQRLLYDIFGVLLVPQPPSRDGTGLPFSRLASCGSSGWR